MKQPWIRALTHTIAVASLATSLSTHAQTTKETHMPNAEMNTTKMSPSINRLIPVGYINANTRSIHVDADRATLMRYEREDHRNNGIGGEHFSIVIDDSGRLKGFAHMDIALMGGTLPTHERAREIALDFLREMAPDLLPRMEIAWIKPHDETIHTMRNGQRESVILTGMKVKARNLADGRWFWVIVGTNEKVMVFERDIVWITFPGRRKTEKWLHDQWLAEQNRKPAAATPRLAG
jgi:hypothetical protein